MEKRTISGLRSSIFCASICAHLDVNDFEYGLLEWIVISRLSICSFK